LYFLVEGNVDDLCLVSGNATLKNTTLVFSKKYLSGATFKIPSGQIFLQNNQLRLPKTDILYATPGESFQGFSLMGVINFLNLNLIRPEEFSTFLDLFTEAPSLKIMIPDIYQGMVSLKNMSLHGVYKIPISETSKSLLFKQVQNNEEKGPILKGSIELSQGTLSIPNEPPKLYPSLLFDLKLSIDQQVAFNTAALGSGAFAGFSVDLGLDKTETPLLIQGTLNHPKILNKLTFKEGNIQFLNRSFALLSATSQKSYQDEFHENSISFESKSNDKEAILDISTLAIIEKPVEKPSAKSTYSHVLVGIQGPISNLENIKFTVFESMSDRVAPSDLKLVSSYVLSNRADKLESSEGILKVLFPEIFNFSEKQQLSRDDTSQLLTNFGEQRVNSFVKKGIRPLERRIAKVIGLEGLQVDYNLGAEFFKQQDVKRVLGVNMIKSLSNQLFIRVKTNLDLRSERGNSQGLGLSEVEMTYEIFPNKLFLNYANIKDDNTEIFKPKLSLRFRYEY